ncbi:MAG: carbohydrate ABC transporter permease [Spirochaetaceae bacterium]|jgi:putative aldouronate transport system permease protein|nr:carbohydrate ABC transporter permease [Spirochaetaceae bacterium]
MKKRTTISYVLVVLFVGLFSFICLYPFLLVISGSFTTRAASTGGFTLIPKEFTLESYRVLFSNSKAIIDAYRVTVLVTVSGTALAVFINSMMAFVLTRPFFGRKFFNIYILITMLFSGGMVPWYIICTRYLHLQNTYLALVLPMVVSAWNIFLIRSYFKTIPDSLYESARIDGAGDFMIYRRIYLPLGKPVLAIVLLFSALGYWNDWWLGLMLVERQEMQPLQMLLRAIISNIQFLQTMDSSPQMQMMMANIPGEGVRMALVLITTGPILLLYPFVQRYFVKGIMLGSIKG